MSAVTLRYFAGAADAAGARNQTVELAEGSSVAELCELLRGAHGPEFARILAVSAVLIDGKRMADAAIVPVHEGVTIDVLPPFAGG